jgi:hypothetical protein
MDSHSGGQIGTWRMIQAYASFADVDVFSVAPPGTEPADELRATARRVVFVHNPLFYFRESRLRTALLLARIQLAGEPFRIAKFEHRGAAERLREWRAEADYDLVHCDALSAAPYGRIFADLPRVLAEHDNEWEFFERLADGRRDPLTRAVLRREARRTKRSQWRALGEFDHVVTVSPKDRETLQRLRPERADRITLWPFPLRRQVELPERRDPPGPFTVLILGSMRGPGPAHGAAWFVENVWDEVRARRPDARLEVVGASPPPAVVRRDGRDGVVVHGFVDDIEPILARVHVCAIPLFIGSGLRVKVMEMIPRGIPCIGNEVALQGLDWLPGTRLAPTREAWVEELVRAAGERELPPPDVVEGARELRRQHTPEAAARHFREVARSLGVLDGERELEREPA